MSSPRDGNVVQTARTNLNGERRDEMTLALGFGADRGEAIDTARASLERGFDGAARAYDRGWHDYVDGLKARPASARAHGPAYWVSAMVLAASEDKRNRGAHIASPSMPWAWGLLTIEEPSAAYHLVWPRDLYQVATAQHALGDSAAANRLLDFTFERQQKPDGSFPQNTRVDGAENWTNLQMDEVALPIVLAWQLRRFEPQLYEEHVKKAADFIAANGPYTPQERWENQSGWSPGTIAAEIAGLVCAADIARRNGDAASAQRWELLGGRVGGAGRRLDRHVERPLRPEAVLPAAHEAAAGGAAREPGPERGHDLLDRRRRAVGRRPAERGRPELPRAGAPRRQAPRPPHGAEHAEGRRRAARRRHAERPLLAPLQLRRLRRDAARAAPGTCPTRTRSRPSAASGRSSPASAASTSCSPGDRRAAAGRLGSMAGAANEGWMIPEQVWDEHPPSGRPGFPRGEGTLSATPLAWSHAQFIRLAWSLDAGRPVEQPRVVACRYAGC